MLTEIEWWGGLLLIWLSLSTYLSYLGCRERQKFGFDELSSYIAFLCAAGVFAVYFYPLDNLVFQQVYLGAIVIGVIMLLMMNFWPDPKGAQLEDAEETSSLFNMGVSVFLNTPFIACLGFGAYKLSTYKEVFSFLG